MISKSTKKSGSILVFTLIIMMILLTAGLSIGSITVIERRTAGLTTKSNQAFQIADSAAEIILYNMKVGLGTWTLTNLAGAITSASCNGSTGTAVFSGYVDAPSTKKPFRITFIDTSDVLVSNCNATLQTLGKMRISADFSGTTRAIEVPIPPRNIYVPIDSGLNYGIRNRTDERPVIVYTNSTSTTVKLAICGDMNCSSVSLKTVADGTSTYVPLASSPPSPSPALIIDSNNKPIVFYYSNNNNVISAACSDEGCSSFSYSIVTSAVPDKSGLSAQIYNDKAYLLYYLNSSTISFIKCGNSTCTSGNSAKKDIDTGGLYIQQASLALDSSGLPSAVYKNSTDTVKVSRCAADDCSSTVSNFSFSTLSDCPAQFSYNLISAAIAFDGSDNPNIFYMCHSGNIVEPQYNVVKLVRCPSGSCSSASDFSQKNVIGSMYGWSNISALIGQDGKPFVIQPTGGISYQYLAVNKCFDAACTSASGIKSSSFSPNHNSNGPNSSVASGSDEIPVASYTDGPTSSKTVYFLKCGTAKCDY